MINSRAVIIKSVMLRGIVAVFGLKAMVSLCICAYTGLPLYMSVLMIVL